MTVKDKLQTKLSSFTIGVLVGVMFIILGIIALGPNIDGFAYGGLMIVIMFVFIALARMSRKDSKK